MDENESDRIARLVAEGLDDLENGRFVDYDVEGLRKFFDKLKARATGLGDVS